MGVIMSIPIDPNINRSVAPSQIPETGLETVFTDISTIILPNCENQPVQTSDPPMTREAVMEILRDIKRPPLDQTDNNNQIQPGSITTESSPTAASSIPTEAQNAASSKKPAIDRKNTPLDQETAQKNKHYADYMGKPGRTGYTSEMDPNTNAILTRNSVEKTQSQAKKLKENLLNKFNTNDFIQQGKTFVHKKTGVKFHIVVNEEKKEVGVCFYGLGMGPATGNKGIKAALREFLGGKPKAAEVAKSIGEMVKNICKDYSDEHNETFDAVMIGHSHGGGLAQYAAAANGVKGVVFNSRPLGAALRKQLIKEGKLENESNIYHFSSGGDFLTDNKFFNFLSKGIKKIAGRNALIPQNIGHQYKMEMGELSHGGGLIKGMLRKHNNYSDQIKNAADQNK